MAGNVTINVQGRGGTGGTTNPQPDNGSNRPPISPDPSGRITPGDTTRLIDALRDAVISQAGSYSPNQPSNRYTPLISQIGEQYRTQMNADITARYEAERQRLSNQAKQEYERIDREVDADIARTAQGVTDPYELERITDYYEPIRNRRYQQTGRRIDQELDEISRRETEERNESEEELTRTIAELTEEIRRSGGNLNPNSYLSQLRQQRQQAIIERDSAEDEAAARAAGQRVRELDEQIRGIERGEGGGNEDRSDRDIDWGMRALRLSGAVNSLITSAAGGNLGGILGGITSGISALLPTDDKGSALFNAAVSGIPIIGSLLQGEAMRSDSVSPLAMLMQSDPTYNRGRGIRGTNATLQSGLINYAPGYSMGVSIKDIGLDNAEFARAAAERIKQRGISQFGISEAFNQIMLEHSLSLGEGQLGQLGVFDRYGVNASNAVTDLTRRLERASNSGVREGDYARMGEYVGLQSAVMQQQMGYAQAPSFGVANNMIEAFSNMGNGYTVDSRTAGDIAAMNSAVSNPGNDRMKAILYSVVEELDPSLTGQPHKIDQFINDPKNRGRLITAVSKRLEQMYGSTDTAQGYFAYKDFFQGITAGNIMSISQGINHGAAGDIMSGPIRETTEGIDPNMLKYIQRNDDYTSPLTQSLITITEDIYAIVGALEPLTNGLKQIIEGINQFFGAGTLPSLPYLNGETDPNSIAQNSLGFVPMQMQQTQRIMKQLSQTKFEE